jgi:hypothetical protein
LGAAVLAPFDLHYLLGLCALHRVLDLVSQLRCVQSLEDVSELNPNQKRVIIA